MTDDGGDISVGGQPTERMSGYEEIDGLLVRLAHDDKGTRVSLLDKDRRPEETSIPDDALVDTVVEP